MEMRQEKFYAKKYTLSWRVVKMIFDTSRCPKKKLGKPEQPNKFVRACREYLTLF